MGPDRRFGSMGGPSDGAQQQVALYGRPIGWGLTGGLAP